ncbi:ExbD/TolR family protein [Lutimaribacter marinistellae]|uniref:ExbD/TolR family protein n=1 Tax=Lutimaribacter marinistellae TaxID=1820329 RepID=A0ABV7TJ85_9RHOB
MDLSDPPRRQPRESIVPMINVVFLLLIFFLMTSKLAQPDPFEVSPPKAASEAEVEAEPVLYVSRDGEIAYNDLRGAAAIGALSGQAEDATVIRLRADAQLDASKLAAILRDLSSAGLVRVELVVTTK